MIFKNVFKKEDKLTKELKMLPRETRKRILDNVNRRKNEILEEKILEQQLKQFKNNKPEKGKWATAKEGMARRREELRKQGILKPLIRYDKKNQRSVLEEMSMKSREAEIKRIETQRTKLKSGHSLNIGNGLSDGTKINIKELKLKVPKNSKFEYLKKKRKKNGFV